MKKVKLLNKMAKVGLDELPEGYVVGEDVSSPEAILVRSADMHSYEMNPELLAIARAGAGVNNIPIAECASKGIVVFNTPGANANAVKELVLAGLLLASRDIVGGIEWVKDNSDDQRNNLNPNYTYTSKSVKLLFRRSVDPNITGRIHEIIKATLDYYGKSKVYLKIKATVPDTETVILEFVKIPMEEMELLGNIIKVLGNSGLGIAKAILE